MNPFKYIKIEKIKKFSQLMRGLLLWFFSLIFCVVSLIVYSTGTLNLTHFLIKGVEQDENGYYLVEDDVLGQLKKNKSTSNYDIKH